MTRPLFLATCLTLAGCDSPAPPKPDIPIPPADQKAVSDGTNAFTLELYQKLAADNPGNVVLSPFSVRTALGMLAAGARGESAESLRKVLHFDLPDARLHAALGGTAQNLAATEPYEFASANAVWPKLGLALKPAYANVVTRDYAATVETLDFAQPEAARKRINAWTAERTRSHIPELLKPGILGSDTTMVLTNAVYFKGAWKKKFDPNATRPADFTTAKNEVVPVPTMWNSDMPGAVSDTKDGTWIRLPYQGDRLAMVIAMPPKWSKPGAMLAGLTAARLAEIIGAMRESKISVSLPKFEFKTAESLLKPLTEMGFVNADGGFDGIADGVGSVSAVEHAATIEVNEEGTVATATTAGFVKTSAPRTWEINRAFAFLIHDAQTGTVLFVGHVGDPR